jgi:hypothetical protein
VEAKTRIETGEPWAPTGEYSARIGGIIYRNVEQPIVVNGKPVLKLYRNTETGQLGVSFNINAEDGSSIAKIEHNVLLDVADGYMVMKGQWGTSLIHPASARIWCDVRPVPAGRECELDVSYLFFSQGARPLFLHPDRTCIGRPHENEAPNFSGFTVTTQDENSTASAFGLNGADCYMIDIAIENFATGINITYSTGSHVA